MWSVRGGSDKQRAVTMKAHVRLCTNQHGSNTPRIPGAVTWEKLQNNKHSDRLLRTLFPKPCIYVVLIIFSNIKQQN